MVDLAKTLAANGKLVYEGKPISAEDSEKYGIAPYIPSPELVNAVNLAIFLEKRPLLLKGEPGCGKTRLAEAVAHELDLPIFTWYIKSTSRARDGLYTYDAVKRLHDAQLVRMGKESQANVDNLTEYIKDGALGEAFKNEQRTVVLIDEIDKADIDFPNDLLRELDEQKFTIDETGELVEAEHPPIVFITSNDEKDLQDALTWALGKSLADMDYKFLLASQDLAKQEAEKAKQEAEKALGGEDRDGKPRGII